MNKPKFNTVIVNLFAGPGAGKSSMTFALLAKLKAMGVNCEGSFEYAKTGEWEGRTGKIREAQFYIAAKQHFRQHVLDGEVQVVVCDGPILLGIVYQKHAKRPLTTLPPMLMELHNQYDNINFYVKRTKPYMQIGRSQTEEQAKEKDEEVKNMLVTHDVPFIEIPYGDEGLDTIMYMLEARKLTTPWHEVEGLNQLHIGKTTEQNNEPA
jgi:hypothetical protein